MNDDAIKGLCVAIIARAAEDYKILQKRGVSKVVTKDEGAFSYKDIDRFFASRWGGAVVNATTFSGTVEEMYNYVKTGNFDFEFDE